MTGLTNWLISWLVGWLVYLNGHRLSHPQLARREENCDARLVRSDISLGGGGGIDFLWNILSTGSKVCKSMKVSANNHCARRCCCIKHNYGFCHRPQDGTAAKLSIWLPLPHRAKTLNLLYSNVRLTMLPLHQKKHLPCSNLARDSRPCRVWPLIVCSCS